MKSFMDFFKRYRAVFITVLITGAFVSAVMLFFKLSTKPEKQPDLVVVSPHPTAFMIPLIKEFENETGIRTEVISLGTSDAIKRIIGDENVDVLWGGSVLTVSSYADRFIPADTKNRKCFENIFSTVDERITCFTLVPSVIMVSLLRSIRDDVSKLP